MFEINYTLIFIAAIAQFILGAIWYSPLMFGKMWMEIMESSKLTKEEMKNMQKQMTPFYALQFFLGLFMTISFAILLPYITPLGVYHTAFSMWIGFIVPVQIGGVIWANTKKKYWLKQIFVMTSFTLVEMMLIAYILTI